MGSYNQQFGYDLGDGRTVSVSQARRDAAEYQLRQAELKRQEIERLRGEAQELAARARSEAGWVHFWEHASLFYDSFFSSFSFSYPFTVAALEHLGYITPAMRAQLVAHTPSEHAAQTGGMLAGIVLGFWLPGKVGAGQGAFKLGTRSHFWSLPRGTNFSTLAVDAAKVSKAYGLINFHFHIPGVLDFFYTVNNANVFGVFKAILGQVAVQTRKAVERGQDR